MRREVRSVGDLLSLLDGMFAPRWTTGGGQWWDGFYADRSRPVPFFADKPDENLVAAVEDGVLAPGRALDLGCGPGRNASYLAGAGFTVDAVDLSATAIAWAAQRARETGTRVRFVHGDACTADLPGPYDLVYDSGCLHHLPPHRRIGYLALLDRVLAPGGLFGLTCFASGWGACEDSDAGLYRTGDLAGGLAFTPDALRRIFATLTEVAVRPMRAQGPDSRCFGEPFLLTALFRGAGGYGCPGA